MLPDLTSLATSGPYGPGGTNYLAMAGGEMPTVPQPMTQDQLEKTPGYQFTLNQGLKSVQSSAAARGLGVSGAALKGAATYATGLASSNYQQQFNNQQQLFQNQQQRFTNAINLNTTQQGNLHEPIRAASEHGQLGRERGCADWRGGHLGGCDRRQLSAARRRCVGGRTGGRWQFRDGCGGQHHRQQSDQRAACRSDRG